MEENMNPTQTAQRPGMLTTLCILTFIWSGLWTLLSLVGIFASGWLGAYVGGMLGGFGDMGTGIFIVVFVIMLIFWGLSLLGAIKMFGLKKSGFILYVIPNGLMALLQIFSIATAFTTGGLVYLLVSILFIVLYAQNLKFMK